MGAKPILLVNQIQDIYVRKNTQSLDEYFQAQNQFLDFTFFDLEFTKAVFNFKLAHGLTEIPEDIVVTKITGDGICQFNHGLFDIKNIDISTSGACRIRFYIGKYWKSKQTPGGTKDDFTQYCASIVPGQVINQTTINNFTSSTTIINTASSGTSTPSSASGSFTFSLHGPYADIIVTSATDQSDRFIAPYALKITDAIMGIKFKGTASLTQLDLKRAAKATPNAFTSIFSTPPSAGTSITNGEYKGILDSGAGWTVPVLSPSPYLMDQGDVLRLDVLSVMTGASGAWLSILFEPQ